MPAPRLLAPLAAAALVVALPAAAHAQHPVRVHTAAGTLPAAGYPDAGFQHAYSFRASGFAAGSGAAAAIAGGSGSCRVGDACESTVARDFAAGEPHYFLGLDFGGDWTDAPSLYVNSVNTGTAGAELVLDGYVPATPLNAFYVVLTPAAGGALALGDAWFTGAPPTPVGGFSTMGGGAWYALFRSAADLRDNLFSFDLAVTAGTAGAGAPTVEIHVGTMAPLATPEPATLGLTAAGLAVLLAAGRRARRRPGR